MARKASFSDMDLDVSVEKETTGIEMPLSRAPRKPKRVLRSVRITEETNNFIDRYADAKAMNIGEALMN